MKVIVVTKVGGEPKPLEELIKLLGYEAVAAQGIQEAIELVQGNSQIQAGIVIPGDLNETEMGLLVDQWNSLRERRARLLVGNQSGKLVNVGEVVDYLNQLRPSE